MKFTARTTEDTLHAIYGSNYTGSVPFEEERIHVNTEDEMITLHWLIKSPDGSFDEYFCTIEGDFKTETTESIKRWLYLEDV